MLNTEQNYASGSARQAVEAAIVNRQGISLSEVMATAALQTRVDKKFLVTPDQFTEFVARLGTEFRVMQINGLRSFQYRSTYFDTPDFEQYRAHRQGRRKRYKVRSRTYVDTQLCMFEIKTKGRRGATVKHRRRQPLKDAQTLTPQNRDFAAQVLADEYEQTVPALQPVMHNSYVRATLVDPVDGERVTGDVDLRYFDDAHTVIGPEMVVVETKSSDGRGVSDQALAGLGIRPVSMSKYCLGVAALHPELPANKWARLLNRHEWARVA